MTEVEKDPSPLEHVGQFLATEDGEFNGNELSELEGLDAETIAKAIVLAACELDDIPDPDDDVTLTITIQSLEAVAHRHITAALERAAIEKAEGQS